MTRHYGEGFLNKQLARDTGIAEQTVSRWLKAEAGIPSIDLVRLTAATLHWNLADAVRAAGYGELVAEVAAALTPAQRAASQTEEELRRDLAALQDEFNARVREMRDRLERRDAGEGNPGNGSAVS